MIRCFRNGNVRLSLPSDYSLELLQFGTPCTGLDYNLLRLKSLAGIIFGQPPRSTIIQTSSGHLNK